MILSSNPATSGDGGQFDQSLQRCTYDRATSSPGSSHPSECRAWQWFWRTLVNLWVPCLWSLQSQSESNFAVAQIKYVCVVEKFLLRVSREIWIKLSIQSNQFQWTIYEHDEKDGEAEQSNCLGWDARSASQIESWDGTLKQVDQILNVLQTKSRVKLSTRLWIAVICLFSYLAPF